MNKQTIKKVPHELLTVVAEPFNKNFQKLNLSDFSLNECLLFSSAIVCNLNKLFASFNTQKNCKENEKSFFKQHTKNFLLSFFYKFFFGYSFLSLPRSKLLRKILTKEIFFSDRKERKFL